MIQCCKLVPMIRWRCSFTKIVLGVLFLMIFSFCFFRYALSPVSENIIFKELTANERALKYTPSENANDDEPKEFMEVMRVQPKVSYSVSSSLDKYLEEERRKHNSGKPIEPQNEKKIEVDKDKINDLTAGGGHPVGNNVMNLKNSLKDPAFQQKIHNLEDRRQDLYIQMLKKRGQIVSDSDGSQTIVSYPKTPVKFPNNLKKNILDWTEKEKIWLNVTHFPWPLDDNCKHYSVQFGSPGSIPIIGLASYPSSGNTWLRYLIEGITGYYTGSMYNDISIRKKGYYGEGVPADAGLVLTVKTHGHTTGAGAHVAREKQLEYNHHSEVNHTAILLIRNPYKAIIGHRNLDSGGHTGFAKNDQFLGQGWQSFIEIKAQHWLNYYTDWLENNPPENILVLHYEHIQQNLK